MALLTQTRERLLCPGCQYDVAATLASGFVVCPECGGAISYGACAMKKPLPQWVRWLMLVSFGLSLFQPLWMFFERTPYESLADKMSRLCMGLAFIGSVVGWIGYMFVCLEPRSRRQKFWVLICGIVIGIGIWCASIFASVVVAIVIFGGGKVFMI